MYTKHTHVLQEKVPAIDLEDHYDEEEELEDDLWDYSCLETRDFISRCCQQPVDQQGIEPFCTGCGETLDPGDMLEMTDEEEFMRQDYEDQVKEVFRAMSDFD